MNSKCELLKLIYGEDAINEELEITNVTSFIDKNGAFKMPEYITGINDSAL